MQRAPLRQLAEDFRSHPRPADEAAASTQPGFTVLFAGPSGTGKTMAAIALARALRRHLLRVDLARVVSKYIGETEKNLDRIFAAADDTGAILLFDEADALFGQRGEVRDSHDRYANIGTNGLLRRIEHHDGLVILTANMKSVLDEAFLRRLRRVVDFPLPDEDERNRA
jgi:SpoVK/Ycf46/Vps4 family AAA+-type ATPase